jgi:uncharacterized membrane protein YfcA
LLTLALGFFIIAVLYATVGFGGGTSYIAVLAAAGTAYTTIPKISLTCNLLVVIGGFFYYLRRKHFNAKFVLPFVIASVPLAFIGGSYPLKEKTYFLLLAVSLSLCGIRILFIRDREPSEIKKPNFLLAATVGGALGLLSGMVGIGGGIFLSPLLINCGWARSKEAASVANTFILLNSLAGLAGQFTKDPNFVIMPEYLPLFIAVIVGGQIGSLIGTHSRVSYALIQRGTGLLTLFISLRLLLKYL